MKVAIVHDYLMEFGGAERVLLALHEIYPDAPIYTILVDERKFGSNFSKFEKTKIVTSWFDKLPYKTKLISPLRFLVPFIWRSFDLSSCDLIIDSSAWAITRGFKSRKEQVEICYLHTPPRYLYGFDTSRNWGKKWFGGLISIYAKLVNGFLRHYDYQTAQKVDYFIANSENVKKRIEKFYKRDAVVIYPPVEAARLHDKNMSSQGGGSYFLTGGRLVGAKNFDVIIKACKKAGVALKIFGGGVMEEELRNIADDSVEFLGKVSDEELFDLYKNAKGFIVAQRDEDFGITTVEAQGVGCPVVAYRGGGYLETVVDGKTGLFFDGLNVDSLVGVIKRFEKMRWNRGAIENSAKRFSKENFKNGMRKLISEVSIYQW